MSDAKALRGKAIARIKNAASEPGEDLVAVEEPLEIRVAGRSIAVVMRTPGHDRELAAGFAVTEGIIRSRDEILDIVPCSGGAEGPRENSLDILLASGARVDFARLSRNVFTSSSCGVCSKASIEAVRQQLPPLPARFSPSRRLLATLPSRLRAEQRAFAATGGVHASAVFGADGDLQVLREDVGRHNAVDKVIGWALLAGALPLRDSMLLVSGRVSFEIVQKALAAGIPCVAAVSAPTSAAVELAEEAGLTLVGFLRSGEEGSRMNVYAGTLTD